MRCYLLPLSSKVLLWRFSLLTWQKASGESWASCKTLQSLNKNFSIITLIVINTYLTQLILTLIFFWKAHYNLIYKNILIWYGKYLSRIIVLCAYFSKVYDFLFQTHLTWFATSSSSIVNFGLITLGRLTLILWLILPCNSLD